MRALRLPARPAPSAPAPARAKSLALRGWPRRRRRTRTRPFHKPAAWLRLTASHPPPAPASRGPASRPGTAGAGSRPRHCPGPGRCRESNRARARACRRRRKRPAAQCARCSACQRGSGSWGVLVSQGSGQLTRPGALKGLLVQALGMDRIMGYARPAAHIQATNTPYFFGIAADANDSQVVACCSPASCTRACLVWFRAQGGRRLMVGARAQARHWPAAACAQRTMSPRPMAPGCRVTSCPPLNKANVGMLRI